MEQARVSWPSIGGQGALEYVAGFDGGRQSPFPGQPGHESRVLLRLRTPDAVIEVGHVQLNPVNLAQAVQDVQQAEGIGAAGYADYHRPTPSQETMSVNSLADFRQDIH